MKEIKIEMIISAEGITEELISDEFVQWVEYNGWSCGGMVKDVSDDIDNTIETKK